VTESVFWERVRAAGLSLWELGDLLGIHPHHLNPHFEPSAGLPAVVLVELARRLDMHPGELVPALFSAGTTAGPGRAATEMAGPVVTEAIESLDADATLVLTALSYAVESLAVDDLAAALEWPLCRVAAALGHAAGHPRLAGPVALRRTGHDTYTVTARLDQLSGEQLRRLGQAQLYRHPLTPGQAHILLAAFALRGDPQGYREHRANHPDAERELTRAGLVRSEHSPDRPDISQDVWFSLRYFNTPREDHH
jgi:hypothetical protein